MLLAKKIGLAIGAFTLLGCGTTSKLAMFRNSALFNTNNAPTKHAPPSNYDKRVDEFHMQSTADYQFSLGESYSLDGQTQKAIEAFKAALVYDEKAVQIRVRLAEEYVKSGRFAEALEEAEFAMNMDGNHIPTRILLGNLYSSLKMYDLAISQFQVVLDIEPKNIQAPLFIGAILAEQKKYGEAIKHFTALAENKDNEKRYMFYYYIGRIHSERGEKFYGKAEEAFSDSLRVKPDFERSVTSLAKLYLKMGQMESSVNLLKSFQEKFLSDQDVARLLSQIYIETERFELAYDQLKILEGFDPRNLGLKLQMALMLIRTERFQEANQKLKELLLQAPDSDKVLYYLGFVNESLKDLGSAISYYDKIVPESSYYPETAMHSSQLLKEQGEMGEAVRKIRMAVKARPDRPELYAYYATLLDETKDHKLAVEMLEGAVQRFPENTQLHFFLGSMYDRLGSVKKVISQMEQVIRLDQNHVQALNYLAYTYAEEGENLELAESLVDRAIVLKPNDGYILDTKGWILFKQGRLKQALSFLEKAYSLKVDESIIAEHLADVYYRLELVDKAYKMYVEAAKLENDSEKLAKIQQKLAAINRQRQSVGRRVPASTPRETASKKPTKDNQ
ncbi:MAG: hypothetical protein CL677_01605 [Bdellovibrionaceae bacterium]|nr:hypothetical protein [Pseudobdellovibrionaceae bacterium]|tara:strand:+ start:46075 stop:47931 length:1857 start_codon:yes stop_codon:yes gene_type:complete